MGEVQFWKLQDRDDPEPYGVAAKDDQGLARLFVPGMGGLVDMPSVADFTHMGEVGGHPISEAEAYQLMRAGVGKMSPEAAKSLMGRAPIIAIEGDGAVAVTAKTYIAVPGGRKSTREEARQIAGQLFDVIAADGAARARGEEGAKHQDR